MDDTFCDYLTFLQDRPHIFDLDECSSMGVGLNCWNIHLAFTPSAEGQAFFYDMLGVCRQLPGVVTRLDDGNRSGLSIPECDIVHLKHLLEYMQGFTPQGES
jgi:hypothetical protein